MNNIISQIKQRKELATMPIRLGEELKHAAMFKNGNCSSKDFNSDESAGKHKIIDCSYEELENLIVNLGVKKYRAKQIWQWIYQKGVKSFNDMTDLSVNLREKFSEVLSIKRPSISTMQKSIDGTIKWLVRFDDGNEVEMVYIPEKTRGTLCISSQVGCTLTCKFCHTGTQRLVRNLTAEEILQQVLIAKDHFDDWEKEKNIISNIVLMGMGEPMLNYDNVAKAMIIAMNDFGIAIPRKKITLSTSGIVPQISECAKDLRVNLAISLHAVADELRDYLVPINKKYPLKELMSACKHYQKNTKSKRITFEYVMLKGINDSIEDAKKLVQLVKGIPSIVNLIPFNPWKGSSFVCSDTEEIEKFNQFLENAGQYSFIRTPRGQDILAACGQLKSDTNIRKNKKLK